MRRTLAALCAGILLAACSEGADVQPIEPDPDASGPDVADEAPDEPEPPTGRDDDPFAIPEEIDDAYVQAVLDELVSVRNEALRATFDANPADDLPLEVLNLIDAAHEGPARAEFGQELQEVVRASNLDEIFLIEEDFRGEELELLRTIAAEPTCLVVIAEFDRSGSVREPRSDRLSIASIDSTPAGTDHLNRAPWRFQTINSILDDGGDPMPPQDVLEVSDEEWLDLLESDCGEES